MLQVSRMADQYMSSLNSPHISSYRLLIYEKIRSYKTLYFSDQRADMERIIYRSQSIVKISPVPIIAICKENTKAISIARLATFCFGSRELLEGGWAVLLEDGLAVLGGGCFG